MTRTRSTPLTHIHTLRCRSGALLSGSVVMMFLSTARARARRATSPAPARPARAHSASLPRTDEASRGPRSGRVREQFVRGVVGRDPSAGGAAGGDPELAGPAITPLRVEGDDDRVHTLLHGRDARTCPLRASSPASDDA